MCRCRGCWLAHVPKSPPGLPPPTYRLAQMTELEREFELAERAERRQQEVQRRKLLKQTGKAAQEAAHGPVPAGPTVAGTRSRGETLAGEGAGRSMRSGREEREEAAKKTAMQELVAARKARTEGRCV